MPTPQIDRLDGLRASQTNLRVECRNCGHKAVLDGGNLWRVFAIHRWPDELDQVFEHLRCSVCRRRPTSIARSFEAPTCDPFPKNEAGWQRLVRRARD